MSQPTISALERGQIDCTPLRTVRTVLDALDATAWLDVSWRGGIIARLLDERHAALVGAVASSLTSWRWEVVPELSYSEYGERGSIDLAAWHADSRTLLVIEVKTELVSVESTLRKLDEKVRLGPKIVGGLPGCSSCRPIERSGGMSSGTPRCSTAPCLSADARSGRGCVILGGRSPDCGSPRWPRPPRRARTLLLLAQSGTEPPPQRRWFLARTRPWPPFGARSQPRATTRPGPGTRTPPHCSGPLDRESWPTLRRPPALPRPASCRISAAPLRGFDVTLDAGRIGDPGSAPERRNGNRYSTGRRRRPQRRSGSSPADIWQDSGRSADPAAAQPISDTESRPAPIRQQPG